MTATAVQNAFRWPDREAAAMLLLWVTLFAFYLPGNVGDILFIASLPVLFIYYKEIQVPVSVRTLAIAFALYVLLFVLLSTSYGRSLKGAYDMLRGGLIYIYGYLVVRYFMRNGVVPLFALVGCVFVGANLLFSRTDDLIGKNFFSYYDNPNNAAIQLTMSCCFLLCLLVLSSPGPTRWLASAGLTCGLVLIVLTNSRSAWVGIAAGSALFILCWQQIRLLYRMIILSGVGLTLLGLILWLNEKGFSLRERDVIWRSLFEYTVNERPWTGFGINVVKDVMTSLNLYTQTAHNIFLEAFVSSGVIGLLLFIGLIVYAAVIIFRENSEGEVFPLLCLSIFFCFIVIGQFDLKFSSFKYISTISFCFGTLAAFCRSDRSGLQSQPSPQRQRLCQPGSV